MITTELLKSLKACGPQVNTFTKEWPEGAEVTFENALRALQLGLDLNWLAGKLFTGQAREAYRAIEAPARDAYDAATAQAWKAFEVAKAPAREAYEAIEAPAKVAYDAATAPARKAYEATKAQARDAYQAAKAQAFVNACKIHGNLP